MKEIVANFEDDADRKKQFLERFADKYKDEYLPADWTDKQKNEAVELMGKERTMTAMVTAIPMVCRGPNCQFAMNCPLQQQRRAPIGHMCPYEFAIVKNTMEGFMDRLQVDPEDMVEVLMVRDMVNQEVQQHRATKLLAQESFIQENVVGVDQDGDPIMRKELSLAADYEDKIFKRRQALFKQFNATREAKAKHAAALLNSAEGMSALVQQFDKITRQKDDELKEQLGLSDHDDYIEAKTRELEAADYEDE